MFNKADIEKYFVAEKQESLLFLCIGIAALILAVIFFFALKTAFYKGAALPLLLIGIIQIIVGYTVYTRSDSDRTRNVYAYDMNPGEFKIKEMPRMQAVNKNFAIYRYVEIALALTGLALIFIFKSNTEKTFWVGVGLTLAIQSLIMLGADFFAEKRAHIYTSGIESFIQKN